MRIENGMNDVFQRVFLYEMQLLSLVSQHSPLRILIRGMLIPAGSIAEAGFNLSFPRKRESTMDARFHGHDILV